VLFSTGFFDPFRSIIILYPAVPAQQPRSSPQITTSLASRFLKNLLLAPLAPELKLVHALGCGGKMKTTHRTTALVRRGIVSSF